MLRYLAFERVNQFPMFHELFKLLLPHNTNTKTGQNWLKSILCLSADIAITHRHETFSENALDGGVYKYNNMVDAAIDGFADMYRSLMLTGACVDVDLTSESRRPVFFGSFFGIDTHTFLSAIVEMVRYSSQSGRSDKLLNVVMCSLSANQINELGKQLCEQKLMKENEAGELDNVTDDELQWMSTIETPLRLKHLARGAIIKAMSSKNVKVGPNSSLGLPKLLEEYVQLSF